MGASCVRAIGWSRLRRSRRSDLPVSEFPRPSSGGGGGVSRTSQWWPAAGRVRLLAMHRRGRHAFRVTRRVLLVIGAAGVALTIWGGAVWMDCARQEVRLLDACVRAETASRARLALVSHLVGVAAAGASVHRQSVEALEAARVAAAATALPVDDLTSEARYTAWRDAQSTLSREIDRLWATRPTGVPAAAQLDDLRRRLDRVEEWRSRGAAAVDRSRADFRAATERFPVALVAILVAPEPRAGETRIAAPR